ncbi:MAG: choice-of-anchor J domain-containing protein [Bacteroidales bacterium]|nr:choice-of-anchor J domain-containing protein [Bacteroidales bacterium]
MKTSTFIKNFIFLLFTTMLLSSSFALGQTKKSGAKMTPKMMEMKRDIKQIHDISSEKNINKPNTSRTILAATESNATLYGNLIYSSLWNDLSNVGYYSIDPNSGEYSPVGTSEYLAGAGTVVDGIGYISYAKSYWGIIQELYTIAYDVENASIIETIEHNPEDYTSYAVNMAYDYMNDKIYALTYSEDGFDYMLSEFDRDTYTYSKVSNLYVPSDILAMTFDANGVFYVICADGFVRKLNPSTGTVIGTVCNTGFTPQYMQSACWSYKDNKILWAASNDNESRIIAINVTSGSVETLSTFDHAEEWTSLYTTDPMASEDAPAAPVVQYTANSPGSLRGSISVETPTQNIGGEVLTDTEYTLTIELNNTKIYEEGITPGEDVTMNNVLFIEGINTIRCYATNAAGKGDIAILRTYAGDDTPLPVTNLEVSIAADGKATLTWSAPTGGENGGYLNTNNLTYTIERSGTTIASGITNNYYVDQLPQQIASYEWIVYAVSGDKVSEPASTGSVLFGDATPLPYEQTFDNAASIDLYTIVDNNNDGKTWKYDASKVALTYQYSSSNIADDYAFTPPLQLTNNNMILVEVNACSYSTSYPEKLEITLGSSINPNEQTVIIPATQLDWTEPQVLRAYFSVEESGSYVIGIHAVSLANQYYLLVKDIKVTEGPSNNTPAAVSNVSVTPGANGALNATISFKAPTQTLGGNPLTGNVTVTAYRNGNTVGTKTLAPGANGTITDNNAINGINNYVLTTSNSAGQGDSYEISCLCGIDTPSIVNNLTFTTAADNMTSVMSWEAPTTGANGGYVDTDELVYKIYVPTANGNSVQFVGQTADLFYEITADNDVLNSYTYYVSAKNDTGESDLLGGNVILGTPYALPFIEEIKGTVLVNSPWIIHNEDPESFATWGLSSTVENYNLPEAVTAPDGGMAVCYDNYELTGGECGLHAPKISLEGASAPTLYFAMYHYPAANSVNELSVLVTTDDASFDEIFAKKVNASSSYGWAEYSVSLDDYKDAPWIGLIFNANITDNGFVFLDYVKVENASDNDIMVESLEAPKKVTMGEEVEVNAVIFNKGSNTVSYELSFYLNDKEIETFVGEELESSFSNEYGTIFTTTADHIGNAEVKVVVTMNGNDEVMSNNEATATIKIAQPRLNVVTDLSAKEEDGTVTLSWSAPEPTPEMTDDMEEYESFIIDNIGDYTVVDVDNTENYVITGYPFPMQAGPKAWQVWAPAEIDIAEETWQAYEGSQCLVAFSTISGAADDWLISPEILGGTELSFWAAMPTAQYGSEKFEVLYSTTNTNTSSFQLLSQESKSTTEWELFSYSLPTNAKYFAIRYTSVNIYALLIDDISYTRSDSSTDLVVEGYNVYCNGNKINESIVAGTDFSYEVEDADSYSYNVTVIYNEGESLFSNTATVGDDGIIDMNTSDIKIYGQDKYIKIENVAGRNVNVYALDGRLVYKMKSVDSSVSIPARSGVYIVEVDRSVVRKVVVR